MGFWRFLKRSWKFQSSELGNFRKNDSVTEAPLNHSSIFLQNLYIHLLRFIIQLICIKKTKKKYYLRRKNQHLSPTIHFNKKNSHSLTSSTKHETNQNSNTNETQKKRIYWVTPLKSRSRSYSWKIFSQNTSQKNLAIDQIWNVFHQQRKKTVKMSIIPRTFRL